MLTEKLTAKKALEELEAVLDAAAIPSKKELDAA